MSGIFDFDPIVNSSEVNEEVPEKSGVYVGYSKTRQGNLRITYVGESKNLRKRLNRHPSGCTHFSFEIIEKGDMYIGSKEAVRKKREKELIEKFAPGSNIRHCDYVRGWEEEWIIKFPDDGGRELWKEPDRMLHEGDPNWFPSEKVEDLGEVEQ